MQVEVEANFWPGSLAVKAFYFLFHLLNIIIIIYVSQKYFSLVQNDNLNYEKWEFLTHQHNYDVMGDFH